jgi:D-lactate dehydrogenase
LHNIAKTTLENLKEYFEGEKMTNEICYQCQKPQKCDNKDRCF